MSKIIIDAGHTTPSDPGAVANGTTEHGEVKRIAQELTSLLPTLQEFRAYEVIMVPVEKTLVQKIQYINSTGTSDDIVVSIHMNAAANSEATGVETYYLGGVEERRVQALRFQQSVASSLGLRDRGVKADTTTRHGRLGIVRDVRPVSVLVELGFITNRSDLERVRSTGVQAVVWGLRSWLGLRPATPVTTPIAVPTSPTSMTQLLELEHLIDVHLQKGRQITAWEHELAQKRQAWDLELDRLRGLLLGEIANKQEFLDPTLLKLETQDMRALAIKNNELIEQFVQHNARRSEWEASVTGLRKALKNYLPK